MAGEASSRLAHPGQSAVLAVADRDHEVGADEDHDLAGLDDLPGLGHRLVLDVVHRLEDQEQRLVVALQLRPLVGVHRVLDGQFVQSEHVGDGLHLVLVGFVQADPHEGVLALGFELVHLVQRRGVGVLAGQPLAVDVDAAVDHRPRDGDVDGLGVRGGCAWSGRVEGREAERPETKASVNLLSQRRPNSASDNATRAAVVDRRFEADAGALVSTPENLSSQGALT